MEAQWLSCRVLDSRQRGCRFKPHWRHCVVSLSKNINPSLVLVQPRKTCPFITERLLMGCKESNKQTKSGQHEDSKLLKSFRLDIQDGCDGDHLEKYSNNSSSPFICRRQKYFNIALVLQDK